MEKNKYLEQVLQNLPTSTITYTQKPNARMDIPYTLTAKNYTEIFLNDIQLADLTPEEQIILVHSNNSDPTYTPKTVLAGIYQARQIATRSNSQNEAITKCNKALVKLNQETFQKREAITNQISRLNVYANLLEYYLKVEKKCAEYDKKQDSVMAPIRNLGNRLLEIITRKKHVGPPFSQDERDRGAKEWEKFREERSANPKDSNEKVLNQYRYNSSIKLGESFYYLYATPELSSLEEEYAITNIALKILDGSAYQKALRALNRNPRSFVEKVKSLEK